ncbi:hypothetical protein V8J82_18735 [Gymnodinialimonas sp. 2305UL16-5]|uniref:hypothetical protein n=1 Tax=Gymnodinialimonas mytili TaxID=3126503 RepID=UPI0030A4A1A0
MRHYRLWAAAIAVAVTAPSVGASPLNWPEESAGETEIAAHCAAVLSAYGHAYEFAATLTGNAAPGVGDLPETLVQLAGGATRLPDIAAAAAGFHDHAESVARTNFYPRLVGDGTPYLADDGRELVLAVRTCSERFSL